MPANLPANLPEASTSYDEARQRILNPLLDDDEALRLSDVILAGLPEEQVAVQVALLSFARRRGVAEGLALAKNNPSTVIYSIGTMQKNELTLPPKTNNPWLSGSFYLCSAISIAAVFLGIGNVLPAFVSPIVIMATIIAFSILGAFQLRNDERLSEKSFLTLMGMSFKHIPLLRSREKKSEGS